MKENRRRGSLIRQVAIFFAAGIAVTGLLAFFSQNFSSNSGVIKQNEVISSEIAKEVSSAVKEYSAYEWLLDYWYDHADELDIEYDVDYITGTKTYKKCLDFEEKNPGLNIRYVKLYDIQRMSEEDRKLYAEITYSWLITRINQIKRAYKVDFLFCVETEKPFNKQFFVFSAADPGSVRGTEYEQVYTLGVEVEVSESQQEAMQDASGSTSHMADAGTYLDYYTLLTVTRNRVWLIGITYNLSSVRSEIEKTTFVGMTLAMIYQLLLSAICILLIYRFVLRPLRKVQKNIYLYRNTKESEEVIKNLAEVHPRNEIGQLSTDVADLAAEMDDYMNKIQTITAEKERIGAELSLATRIQASLLPHTFPPFPDRREFDIYASMDPAKEVGGDFYDYFFIDEDRLGIVMADVSGKGVPAALFMAISKIIIQNTAMFGRPAEDILKRSNEIICANNEEEMFVTVWFGILHISTGIITAANAGHEYPVVRRAGWLFELIKDQHCVTLAASR